MSPRRKIGSRKLLRAMGILKRKRYPCSLYCLCSGPGNSIIYLADNQKRAWFFWLPRACHPLLQWCVGKNLPGITSRLLWPVRELFDCLRNDLSLRQRESKQVSKTGPGKEYFKTSSQILRELLKDVSVSWRLKHLAEKISCSIDMISSVKTWLCEQQWAVMDEEVLKITDAEALMITWEEVWIVERDQILHCYTLDSIPVFGERCWQAFSKPGLETFLTGFSECVRYTLRSSATIGYTCRSVNRQQDISGS